MKTVGGRLLALGLALLLPGMGVAAPAAAPPPVELTLQDCVTLAVRNNLSVLLAQAGTAAARGRVLQSASALLPRLTGRLEPNAASSRKTWWPRASCSKDSPRCWGPGTTSRHVSDWWPRSSTCPPSCA